MQAPRSPYKNFNLIITIYYPLKEYYINKNPDIEYKSLTFNPLTNTLFVPTMKPKSNFAFKKETISVTRMIDGFTVFFPDDVKLTKEYGILELYSSYCVIRAGASKAWPGEYEQVLNTLYWDSAFRVCGIPPIEYVIANTEFSIDNLVKYNLLVDSDLYDTATFMKMVSKSKNVDTFSCDYRFDNLLKCNSRGTVTVHNRQALDTLDQYLSRDYYDVGGLEKVVIDEFNARDDEGKHVKAIEYNGCLLRVTRGGRLHVRITNPDILDSIRRGNCLTAGFAYKWSSKQRIQHFKSLLKHLESATKKVPSTDFYDDPDDEEDEGF